PPIEFAVGHLAYLPDREAGRHAELDVYRRLDGESVVAHAALDGGGFRRDALEDRRPLLALVDGSLHSCPPLHRVLDGVVLGSRGVARLARGDVRAREQPPITEGHAIPARGF